MRKLISSLMLTGLLIGSAAAADPDFKLNVEEARKVTAQLAGQIAGELLRELDSTGPMRAIIVCKYSAPEATSALSRLKGYHISRVSLRPRNRALGEPDAWEQKILLDFEKRASKGEKIDGMEFAEIVTEPMGKFFRYLRAIPTAQVCQTCHGKNISEGVKAQLESEYPFDNAVNYPIGSVRGAFTVKKLLAINGS